MHYELVIGDFVYKSRNKESLYKIIGKNKLPWVLYKHEQSAGDLITLSKFVLMSIDEIRSIKEHKRRGYAVADIKKKFQISEYTVAKVIKYELV